MKRGVDEVLGVIQVNVVDDLGLVAFELLLDMAFRGTCVRCHFGSVYGV